MAHADEAQPRHQNRLATARFQLAQLLWDVGLAEHPRALALATTAHEQFLAHGPPDALAKSEQWLANHRLR